MPSLSEPPLIIEIYTSKLSVEDGLSFRINIPDSVDPTDLFATVVNTALRNMNLTTDNLSQKDNEQKENGITETTIYHSDVYIATYYNSDDNTIGIGGVFSTRERAETWVAKREDKTWSVITYVVDHPLKSDLRYRPS